MCVCVCVCVRACVRARVRVRVCECLSVCLSVWCVCVWVWVWRRVNGVWVCACIVCLFFVSYALAYFVRAWVGVYSACECTFARVCVRARA